MSDVKTLKSYLVSLGFSSNMGQFQSQFEKPLKEAASLVKKETFGITADLLKWQIVITGGFAAIATAIVGTMDKVAMADQDYRLFGERMFMDTNHAKSLKIALDALGEPLEAIAFDPELHERFVQLQLDQKQMQVGLGIDFEKNMRSIRDVNFEFTRFKVELQYLAMGATNSIFKALGSDSGDLLTNLRKVNDWIIKHIPELSDKFAKYLVPVLKDTKEIFSSLWDITKEGTVIFQNLIGILSGDTSIEGTTASFDKLAKSIEHCLHFLKDLLDEAMNVEKALGHMAIGVELLEQHKYAEAGKEFGNAYTDSTKQTAISKKFSGPVGAGADLYDAIVPGGKPIFDLKSYLFGKDTNTTTNNSISSKASSIAQQISKDTGIPANFIFDQFAHETNDFSNRGAKSLNNLAGIRNGKDYRNFDSLDDFASYFEKTITSKRYTSQGILDARTIDNYSASLKNGGYYEDSLSNYSSGLKARDKEYNGQPSSIDNSVTIGDIYVEHSNASANDIANAVVAKVQAKQGTQTQRNFSQLQSVHP